MTKMMDSKLLPDRCLVDTGVLIRALRQRQDTNTPDCTAFFEAMLRAKKTILIAAPSLAEVLRSKPETSVPGTRHVVVVPFDRRAAELLGEKMPWTAQQARAAQHNVSGTAIKYDAMIAACATRWEASVIVALDGDHRKMAAAVGLSSQSPASFKHPQLRLAVDIEDV